MHIETLDNDVLMFRGQSYESVATALIDGTNVLLVDALASLLDAEAMRHHLEDVLKKKVQFVVLTHGMDDHRAGVPLFPDAAVLGHPRSPDLIRGSSDRTDLHADVVGARIGPIEDLHEMSFGRHRLRFFYNEGKTPCSINIELPSSDLLFTGDNVLGQIAFISRSTPERIDRGIDRLEGRAGSRLVEGHQGWFPRSSLSTVRHYLRSLEDRVVDLRCRNPDDDHPSLLQITIEDCLPPGAVPTDFEREWHGHNVSLIRSRDIYRPQGGLQVVLEPGDKTAHAAGLSHSAGIDQAHLMGLGFEAS